MLKTHRSMVDWSKVGKAEFMNKRIVRELSFPLEILWSLTPGSQAPVENMQMTHKIWSLRVLRDGSTPTQPGGQGGTIARISA